MAGINWEDILAGGAGAADEILFGAPEWLLKNLGARKQVEDYIKKHERAYRTGETVGTIGGAFIPIGGIAKALGGGAKIAKAAKMADTVADVARAADTGGDLVRVAKGVDTAGDIARVVDTGADAARVAAGAGGIAAGAAKAKKAADYVKAAKEIGSLAAKGGALGAAEAGVRGFFDEKTPDEINRDTAQGMLWGGLGGTAGGLLGKGLKRLSRESSRIADEAAERGMKSYLGRTDLSGRDTKGLLRDLAGPGAKGLGREKVSKEALNELYRVGRANRMHVPGADEAAFARTREAWGKLDDLFERAFPDARGSTIIDKATDWKELERIADLPGGDVALASLEKAMKDLSGVQGLPNIRNYLSNVAKSTYKATDENAAQATRDMVAMLRRNIDDLVADTAERAGADLDVKALKRDYLPMRAYAEAAARDTVLPTRTNTGSPTMEKMMTGMLLGGGGGATQGETTEDRVANTLKGALLGGVAGFAAKRGAEKLTDVAKSASVPLLQRIAAKAPELEQAGKALSVATPLAMGARAATDIQAEAVAAAEPETAAQVAAAEEGAKAAEEGNAEYSSLIMSRLAAFAEANGVAVDSPDFREFVAAVGQATAGPAGPFDPEKTAKLVYPDREERARFVRALQVARSLSESLAPAVKGRGGLFGIGEDVEERINREVALDKLGAVVGDVAKATGTEKAARKQLQAILSMKASQAKKKELIRNMLATYGIDFDTLERAGLANV